MAKWGERSEKHCHLHAADGSCRYGVAMVTRRRGQGERWRYDDRRR
jgi:hypothetical protein